MGGQGGGVPAAGQGGGIAPMAGAAGGAGVGTAGTPVTTGGQPATTGGQPATTGGQPAATGGQVGNTGGQPAGTGGSTTTTCGTGSDIIANTDGWVDASTNGLCVQGAFWTYSDEKDGGDSTITPEPDSGSFPNDGTGEICVSGSAGALVGEEYGVYYGAGLGFSLCDLGDDAGQGTIGSCSLSDTGSLSVSSITFSISGTFPDTLRVIMHEAGNDESPYVTGVTSGSNTISVASAEWPWGDNAGPGTPANVDGIQWQIPAPDEGEPAASFDFCISAISLQ
jgi:hypothetical protein